MGLNYGMTEYDRKRFQDFYNQVEGLYEPSEKANVMIEVSENLGNLEELATLVKKATDSANKALKSAKETEELSAKWTQRKATIESIQDSMVTMAEAQKMAAEAQEYSFKFQSALAKASANLFILGISNKAEIDSICRKLEAEMRGASKGELDELKKQELKRVVEQLRAQQSMSNTIAKHKDIIKNQGADIQSLKDKNTKHAELIASHDKDIDNLESNVDEIEEDVDAIEKNIDEVEENIDEIEKNIDEVEEDVDAIEKNIDEVEENIDEIEKNIDEVEEDVDAIEKNIDEVEENIDEIEKNIDEVEQKNIQQDSLLKAHDVNLDEIEENVSGIIKELEILKSADAENAKKIASSKLVALISGGLSVVALILSALNIAGII